LTFTISALGLLCSFVPQRFAVVVIAADPRHRCVRDKELVDQI
jgi:hypothetical protein